MQVKGNLINIFVLIHKAFSKVVFGLLSFTAGKSMNLDILFGKHFSRKTENPEGL